MRVTVVKKLVLVTAICFSVLLTGCEEFASRDDFLEMKVKPEQTRVIQILELEKKADVNEMVEINQPAQGEIKLSIEQCRAMTLKNNLDLKVQLIEPAIAAQQVN
ncbi:MAG: hypothetical protein JW947_09155, partial [Sedimentisphaerales bacterium]|nr:hypothetical protein [Sedimentisphaerales bacterium]